MVDRYLALRENKSAKPLRQAMMKIVNRIADVLPEMAEPVQMYLAGGMAVHLYTGYRPTTDVDASFSKRLLLPRAEDLVASYLDDNGKPQIVYFDMNYNTSFALIHPDFQVNAYKVLGDEFKNPKIELRVLAPADLAVSKLARYEGNDREDIEQLAQHRLLTADALEHRAEEAMAYFVGSQTMLRFNIQEAIKTVREIEQQLAGAQKGKNHGIGR